MTQAELLKITDLRSALELLKTIPDQLIETNEPVDLQAELAGVYRHVGAGGTVQRPTRIGPAMIFNNIKGHEGAKVVTGVLASRERVAIMLGTKPERLGMLLNKAVEAPVAPVTIPQDQALCQQVVHYATLSREYTLIKPPQQIFMN
ncbi:UbiD family decarboxylase domain-containing protein [Sporomusa sp. KB1]|jgi:4-hydroxy-3-polyprenylbenzoate decarboxylase|uniref:UbiD family decarboxylase domain-containing protein n=1 Tax=Sporomusa sp. KB1 TaxID=943346 RepID=UPI0011A71444|nr:UbiD family decarboxylase domain-containing protein [Sporomusa sp. KB1]TWH47281.1 4-hydroxy-3-polyprenylbenzoate decarboxylase [Sporomusa sp. KB1]